MIRVLLSWKRIQFLSACSSESPERACSALRVAGSCCGKAELITQTLIQWSFTICVCCGTCFQTTCDITVKILTLWFLCLSIRRVQLIIYDLSVCPPRAGSQPPGKAHRLPPQVTGLLNGDQKLPRPSQAAHLLHLGAVWTIQLHHGCPLQGAHRGEMSSGVGRPDSSPLYHRPSDGQKSMDLF